METRDRAALPSPELKPPSVWQHIDALFDRALDEPTEKRREWVRANAPDKRVAAEVLALLSVASRPGVLDSTLPSELTGTATSAQIMERLTAALAGRYRLEAVLGQGGAATVFRAHEEKHARQVVLKVLRPEVARWIGAERFLAEIQILARLSHPHILALIDSGEADGLLYYVMPYVGGETLRNRLARGALAPDEALPILRDITAALAHAHEQRLVHRDLKPDNILIVSGHAFLMDFGIAKLGSEIGNTGEALDGVAIGTPAYMAPEQAAGLAVDVRADLYSWGLVASEMLVGAVGRPEALSKAAPRGLRRLIERCLEAQPMERPRNGGELLAGLDTFVEERPRAERRARRTAVVAAIVAVIAAVGVSTIRNRSVLSGLSGPVMVMPLTNETGDTSLTVWGRMAGDWLTQGLHQTGRVAVVPWQVAVQAVDVAVRNHSIDRLKDLAAETGAQAIVTGAYYKNGPTIRLQAQVTDVNNGTVLAALQAIEVPSDSIREGIQQLRDRLMAVFAIRSDQRLSDVPGLIDEPPTYEAYRLFDRGMERFNALDYDKSTAAFLDAWRADTAFAIPLVYAATSYLNNSDYRHADSLVRVLRARPAKLTPYHDLTLRYIEAMLAGDAMQALELSKQASAVAPGGRAQYSVATIALSVGHVDEAVKTLRAMDPDRGVMKGWSPYWFVLTHAQHLTGDFETELKQTAELRRRYPDSRAAWAHEARALAALGRVDALDSLMTAAAALPPDTYWSQGAMLVIAGEELEAHGHQGAQRYYDRAIAWLANQLARDPSNRSHRYWMASVYLDRSAPDDAAPYLESLVHDYPDDIRFRGMWGVTAALSGDTALARERLGVGPAYHRGDYLSFLARYAGIAGDTERSIALWSEAESAGLSNLVWMHSSARHELLSVAHDARFRKLRVIPGDAGREK
jgi:tRNA A-37 threonylcarbamoyl transferase component Bud32/tetratricopeptide (TPR) repeat protein